LVSECIEACVHSPCSIIFFSNQGQWLVSQGYLG
jgi:hypothetical protein